MRQFIFIALLLVAVFLPVVGQDVVNNAIAMDSTVVILDTVATNDTVVPQGNVAILDTVALVDSVVANDTIAVHTDSLSNECIVVTDSAIIIPDVLWRKYEPVDTVVDNGLPRYGTTLLFMPLVFEKYENIPYEGLNVADVQYFPQTYEIDKDVVMPYRATRMWREVRLANRMRAARNYLIVNRPDLVKYNYENLPKAPKEYVIINDPTRQTITIVEKPQEILSSDLERKPVKIKYWRTSFSSNIQLSQIYVSSNWYQGGNSSLNLLSDQLFTFSYNDPSGKVLFENLIQWKFNLTTSAEDTVHRVRVSEDLFQINSKFGYKAFGKWFYSTSVLFKTQLLTNYAANSMVKEAEFLSPGELNVGVGLSYSYAYEKPVKLSHTLTLSPLSYNLRFVALPNIDPVKFGIERGRARNDIGSSLDYTMTWDLRYNIRWMTHLYAFTNYKNILLECTNSIDFSFSTYFSARLYVDLRYDDSVAPDPKFGYLQIKELLSLGFSYKI